MAVQAEFGESASESGIRQVEVEPTAPISDVSLQNVLAAATSVNKQSVIITLSSREVH